MPLPTERVTLQEPPTDAEVVRRVLAGDTASFEWLMRRYNQRLFRVARSIIGEDAEAEDVVQDGYVRAFEHLGQFQGRAKFATWLTRIVVHEALAHRRKKHRVRLAQETDMNSLPSREEPAETMERPMPNELNKVLKQAVDALPEELRVVFTLRLVEKLSTDQTAECLQLTPVNVKVRLHRARALVRRQMERELHDKCAQLYAFDGARCDRIVGKVMGRIQQSARAAEKAGG